MQTLISRPPSDLSDPPSPPPPEEVARRWIEQRYRQSPAVARLLAEQAMLAGIAPRTR